MKTYPTIECDGFRLPAIFDREIFRDACKFKPRRGQAIVATFPKCGTTWALQIVALILRKGVPPADTAEYFSLFPFMELTSLKSLENSRKDGCLKTHLPFDRITFSKDAKYIYVARHPADCAVSFYHHVRYFPTYFFSDGTFDEFFEIFVSGETDFGDYFDHLLSWYEQRNNPNVFFITFETLKTDTKRMILEMAKFLGEEYYQCLKDDDEKILKNVQKYSSMEYMKEEVNKCFADVFSQIPPKNFQEHSVVFKNCARLFVEAVKEGHHSVGHFIRKGEIGEGKITLTEDQRERLENRMKEKCAGSDVLNLWKNPEYQKTGI